MKDLFRALAARAPQFSLANLVREALVVPETAKTDELLTEMQRRRTHQAIVIDEYGGTAGLVTLEGLMERIVGEIGSETDHRYPSVVMLADGSTLLDGLLLVKDVNERFGLRIDEATYNTLGGFVLGTIGRGARIGDEVAIDGRAMRVEALDGLRVARVFLSVLTSN